MTSSAIHPELRSAARFIPRSVGRPSVVRLSRLAQRLLDRRPPPPGGEVVDLGSCRVRVFHPATASPDDAPRAAMVWIHGGGFVLGHAAMDDKSCQLWADEIGITVASVNYRLAPEHPFPAALHDCHDALVWLAQRSDVDERRVVIGGASAGGGLAAQLALLARERGEVQPAFQLLIYPMLDDRTVLRTDIDEDGFRAWNNEANRFGWQAYLGTSPGGEAVPEPAAPARVEDLSGLPPAWIGVGTLDLFHDEDVAYAERLRAAGVAVELDVVEGAYHGFDGAVPKSTVAQDFRRSQVAAVRAAISEG